MSDTELIIKTQEEIWDGLIHQDFDKLDSYYREGQLFRHTGGYTQTKDEFYKTIADGTFRYFKIWPVKQSVTITGEKAVLHSHAKTDARIYGYRKVWNMEFDIPYEKVGDRWLPAFV